MIPLGSGARASARGPHDKTRRATTNDSSPARSRICASALSILSHNVSKHLVTNYIVCSHARFVCCVPQFRHTLRVTSSRALIAAARRWPRTSSSSGQCWFSTAETKISTGAAAAPPTQGLATSRCEHPDIASASTQRSTTSAPAPTNEDLPPSTPADVADDDPPSAERAALSLVWTPRALAGP